MALAQRIEQQVDPPFRHESPNAREDHRIRLGSLSPWGRDRQPTGGKHRRRLRGGCTAQQVIQCRPHRAGERRRAVAHPIGLPPGGHATRAAQARRGDEHVGDLQVTGGGGASLRRWRPRIAHHVEKLRPHVAHDGAQSPARPPQVHRLFGVPSRAHPQILNQAVGLAFAVGARDDWFDPETGQRAEDTTCRGSRRKNEDAHRTKMGNSPLTSTPCAFFTSRSTTGRARVAWSGWCKGSRRARQSAGTRLRCWR